MREAPLDFSEGGSGAEVGTPPEGAVPMPVSTGRAKRLEGKVILVTVS